MDQDSILQKFGADYVVDEDTYKMGVHHILADKIAKRFSSHKFCLDTCLGAGFMTIAIAKCVDKVIGVDIDPLHLDQAKQNAKTASVEDKVEFFEGDVLEVIDKIGEFDSAFLDPDWAKVGEGKENHVLELSQMMPRADFLLDKVFEKTKNVCLRLPKEFDLNKLENLPPHESESIYQDGKLKFYCIYFGDLSAEY
ncbi:MAG TPA: methyltransferase domain-containing protein [Candidatus Paceibacterota bacterium]